LGYGNDTIRNMGELIQGPWKGDRARTRIEKREAKSPSDTTPKLEDLREQERGVFARNIVNKWHSQFDRTHEDYKIFKIIVEKYTMKDIESLLDKHRSIPGNYNPIFMYVVATEYLRRQNEAFPSDKVLDNLKPLEDDALKLLNKLYDLLEKESEFVINNEEVNREKGRFLEIRGKEGAVALEDDIRAALKEKFKGASEERERFQSVLGLLYAYLRIS